MRQAMSSQSLLEKASADISLPDHWDLECERRGAPAAAAPLVVAVIVHADVGALEGVAELGVIQLADGARQVLWGVELHDADDAAAVAEDVHIVGACTPS